MTNLDYIVQEESHRYYWLYKWLRKKCKVHRVGKNGNKCVKGFPIYPVFQCSFCRYWWNNMMKNVENEIEF